MKGWKKNLSLPESTNDVYKGLSSHLWIKRILMYGIFVFIAFVFTHMFTHYNLFYTESNSAKYLLSALVQSQAAIIGIVITLTFIAVQLIFSYSPRAVGVALKKNVDMLMLLIFYGISIFYGLFVLRMIPDKLNEPLSQIDFLTFWGSSVSLEYRICFVYCLGIFTFVAIAPYLRYTVNFLKPDNIIKILSHDITESEILKHIKSVKESEKDWTIPMKDDPVQPIADIICGSVMKYDIATTRTGINTMADRAIGTIGSASFSVSGEFEEDLNRSTISKESKNMLKTKKFQFSENAFITKEYDEPEVWRITDKERTCVVIKESGKLNIYDLDNKVDISKHFCNHLRTVGECTVSGGDEGSAIEIIDSLKEIGALTIEMHCDKAAKIAARCIEVIGTFAAIKRLIFVTEAVMDSLGSVGTSAAKNRLGDTTSQAIDSLENVGMHAAENKVKIATQSAAKYLGSVGTCAAENELENAAKQAADSLGVVGNYAAENKLKYATSEAARSLGLIGSVAAEEELEKAVVESLGSVGRVAMVNKLEDAAWQAATQLGHAGKVAVEKKITDAAWQAATQLGHVGKVAAVNRFERVANEAAKSIGSIGKVAVVKELSERSVVMRAIESLRFVGEVAAKQELKNATWEAAIQLELVGEVAVEKGLEFESVVEQVIESLGFVGKIAVGNNRLENTIFKVAFCFVSIGIVATEKELKFAAPRAARCLAELTISSKEIVEDVIKLNRRVLKENEQEFFDKFMDIYEQYREELQTQNPDRPPMR
jgi:hypothetical protein